MAVFIDPESELGSAAKAAVEAGDVEAVKDLLSANPQLVTVYLGTPSEGRTLLHVLTDSPGHRPNTRDMVQALVSRGLDVNSPFVGRHSETALHWAASNDDVEAVDALLDNGADIEAGGGVVGGGNPLGDARVFLQLEAARRLVERGAVVSLHDAATLGLTDRVEAVYDSDKPDKAETDKAFWNACHGGQLSAAKFLRDRGADVNAIPPWGMGAPLHAARASKARNDELVAWLESIGAKDEGEDEGAE